MGLESTESAEPAPRSKEQELFDADRKALEEAEDREGMKGKLLGRLKFGLDPAAMMIVPQVKEAAERVLQALGTTREKTWPLVKDLHVTGPWKYADRINAASDPEIMAYIVLGASCHEAPAYPGFTSEQYLADRARVLSELESFTPDQFESKKQSIYDRISAFHLVDDIPMTEGDPALPLAMRGYRGCVVTGGLMRFAATAEISDQVLTHLGYSPGFGEVYDPGIDDFKRVSQDTPGCRVVWVRNEELSKPVESMTPGIKRIAKGFVLTYKNEALAVEIVKKCTRS